MYKIKVTSKGQVTIPKDVRKKMGINPGDYLEIKEAKEGYIIKKKIDKEKLEKYVGILSKENKSHQLLEELRGDDCSG